MDVLVCELADHDPQERQAGRVFGKFLQPGCIEGHELRLQALEAGKIAVIAGVFVDRDGEAGLVQPVGEKREGLGIVARQLTNFADDPLGSDSCLMGGKPQPLHFLTHGLRRTVQAGMDAHDEGDVRPADEAGIEDVQAAAQAVDCGALILRHALEELAGRRRHITGAGADQPLESRDLQPSVRMFAEDGLERRLQEIGAVDGAVSTVGLPHEVGEDASFTHAEHHQREGYRPAQDRPNPLRAA